MLEMVLGVCLAIVIIGLLVYLYLHEKSEKEYIKQIQTSLTNLPIELQEFYSNVSEKNSLRTHKLIESTFKDYLKHIQKLEERALPSPVTVKGVRQVLNRVGELADEPNWEPEGNEIETEKDKGVELINDQWAGVINADTKVAFEEDLPEAATVIE